MLAMFSFQVYTTCFIGLISYYNQLKLNMLVAGFASLGEEMFVVCVFVFDSVYVCEFRCLYIEEGIRLPWRQSYRDMKAAYSV